ncbi:MAG: hypothetical protein QXY15_10170 [Candidatus Nitrosotenuis sp.]
MSEREVMMATIPPRGDRVEVREHVVDGKLTWSVWYPQEGFIPDSPLDEHKLVRSYYNPTSKKDALEWAEYLAAERKVIYIERFRK